MISAEGVYILIIVSGIRKVATANRAARHSVIRSMIQMVFFSASTAFTGSVLRIPQYLETSTEAPIPIPMQKIW